MPKEVEITIKAKMNERWVNDFLSMLKYMEHCGKIGHSSVVGFYSDGDGDFRPEFEFDVNFDKTEGIKHKDLIERHKNDWNKIETSECLIPGIMFDAG